MYGTHTPLGDSWVGGHFPKQFCWEFHYMADLQK